MERVQTKTRPLPASLAPVVEGLELRQPAIVSRALLRQIADESGVTLPAKTIADRLVRLGWLLPLRSRDSWEFAPGARAGRLRSGDPWIELRALLSHDPDASVAIAFESAVWELGFSSHPPDVGVLAHRRGWRPPRSMGDLRAVTFEWRLPAGDLRGLPVWSPATVVVAAAHRPAAQGDWRNADEWLPEIFRATTPDEVLDEATGRGISTLARLGYLAEWSGREDIAERVADQLPSRLPVSFLGPRERRARWSGRWRVYDAVLPSR